MVAHAIQRVRELTAGTYTGIVAAVILLSWLAFALLPQHAGAHSQAPAGEHSMHGMQHAGMAPMPTPVTHQPVLWIAIIAWIVMTVAMMGPATLPSVRYIEQTTPGAPRRGRSSLWGSLARSLDSDRCRRRAGAIGCGGPVALVAVHRGSRCRRALAVDPAQTPGPR